MQAIQTRILRHKLLKTHVINPVDSPIAAQSQRPIFHFKMALSGVPLFLKCLSSQPHLTLSLLSKYLT